jgi:hypothetical protein
LIFHANRCFPPGTHRRLRRADVEAVLDALTSRVPHAVELRQNSPFAGVLPETERRAVLAAFVASQ